MQNAYWLKVTIILVLLIMTIQSVKAGPEIVSAQAGNLTQLDLFAVSTTEPSWQGYYGNISGSLSLQDASGLKMYAWGGVVNPTGEIFAANETVSNWDNIICINLSSNYKGFNCTGQNEECLNVTEIENYYHMQPSDVDGVNETFNRSIQNITIGTVPLSGCPLTTLFVNSTRQSTDYWNETLLTINNTGTIIYASILNPKTMGFNNQTWDFQMMVGENKNDSLTTTYYMYTEIT